MEDFTIESCKSKKPLGVTINSNFSFDNYKSKDSRRNLSYLNSVIVH